MADGRLQVQCRGLSADQQGVRGAGPELMLLKRGRTPAGDIRCVTTPTGITEVVQAVASLELRVLLLPIRAVVLQVQPVPRHAVGQRVACRSLPPALHSNEPATLGLEAAFAVVTLQEWDQDLHEKPGRKIMETEGIVVDLQAEVTPRSNVVDCFLEQRLRPVMHWRVCINPLPEDPSQVLILAGLGRCMVADVVEARGDLLIRLRTRIAG
eukprot:6491259-Amphidinium_carterae.2